MNNYQQPKVTVIIPLYNKKDEIGRAIDSVLNQSYKNFEVMVIGGKSTDGGENIVKSYNDSRIHLIQETGNGVSAARNQGIDEAKSQLLAFLDADDEWYNNFLETIVYLYYQYPNAGIYGTSFDRCVIDFCKVNKVNGLPSKEWEGYLPSYFNVYAKSGHPPFSPSCVAIDKSVFDNIGMFDINSKRGEDVEMWFRIAMRYPVVFTTKVCARYHIAASNKAMSSFNAYSIHPAVTYLKSIPEEVLSARNDYKDVLKCIEYLMLITAYFNLGSGNVKHAREILFSKSDYFHSKRLGLKLIVNLPTKLSGCIIHGYSLIPVYVYSVRHSKILCLVFGGK